MTNSLMMQCIQVQGQKSVILDPVTTDRHSDILIENKTRCDTMSKSQSEPFAFWFCLLQQQAWHRMQLQTKQGLTCNCKSGRAQTCRGVLRRRLVRCGRGGKGWEHSLPAGFLAGCFLLVFSSMHRSCGELNAQTSSSAKCAACAKDTRAAVTPHVRSLRSGDSCLGHA